MQWTAEQEQVLAHGTGWCQVLGGPATGRTSVLVERWRRRAAGRPDRLLVVCRSRDAAEHFREAALADDSWTVDTLAITTFFGVAFDLLRRLGRAPRLLGRSQQWSLVRRLLAAEDARSWPGCAGLLGRAAFVDQVAAAVLAVEAAGVEDEQVMTVADRWGLGERWADLLAFRHRYRQATRSRGVVDEAQLFREAVAALDDDRARDAEARRWDEILIDDADAATAAMGCLAESLPVPMVVAVGEDTAGLPSGGWPRWRQGDGWGEVVRFGPCLRVIPAAVAEECRHPSSEPEAVAARLAAAHRAGVAWRDMVVLMPRAG
ncbi:MAG: UvrD-helicase domain-containing protein, partial [Acidimicrobiales bacterium]